MSRACDRKVTGIGDAPYTIQAPPRPVEWQSEAPTEELDPAITVPSPPERQAAVRVAATTLVSAVVDVSEDGHSYTSGDGTVGLSPTTFGTVVHRLSELRPHEKSGPRLFVN